MKTTTRLMLIACLVLPFAACTKDEATQQVQQAPVSAPTTEDRGEWVNYISDVVNRNMEGITNQPFVYLLPGESTSDFQDQYDRLGEKITADVSRGIVKGNLLAYASPASAKMADAVVTAFEGVEANTMKGVRVVFIGKTEDGERVKTAVAPAGVEYVFVDVSK